MAIIKIHLTVSDKDAKFLSGPIICPSAGPTLDKALIAPEKQVTKSKPQTDKARVVKIAGPNYKPIKTKTLIKTSSDIT